MILRLVLVQLFILQQTAFTMPPKGLGNMEFMDIRKYPTTEHPQSPFQERKLLSLAPDDAKPGDDSLEGLEIGAENGTTDVVAQRQVVAFGAVPFFHKYAVTTVLVYMLVMVAAFWCICISCNVLKRLLSMDCTNRVRAIAQRCPSPPRVWFFKRGNEQSAEQELQTGFREDEN